MERLKYSGTLPPKNTDIYKQGLRGDKLEVDKLEVDLFNNTLCF